MMYLDLNLNNLPLPQFDDTLLSHPIKILRQISKINNQRFEKGYESKHFKNRKNELILRLKQRSKMGESFEEASDVVGRQRLLLSLYIENFDLPDISLPFMPDQLPAFNLFLKGMLPPVIKPAQAANTFNMQVGDVELALFGGDPNDPKSHLMTVFVGFDAKVTFTSSNNEIVPKIDNIELWFDLVKPHIPFGIESTLESFLGKIIQKQLVPIISDALIAIQIPQVSGVTISNMDVSTGGTDNGFINASANISF